MIKLVKSDSLRPLTTIINLSLQSGIFPDKLKIAKVIPLFKMGDSTLIENYRPVADPKGGAACAPPPFRVPKTKKPAIFGPKYALERTILSLRFQNFSDPSRGCLPQL